MGQLLGSSFCSRLKPAVWPEASGGATKSNTRTNRSAARPTDSHFLIGVLLSALTLDTALICTRAAAYLIAPQLAAVKSNCRGATAEVDATAGARSRHLDDRDAPRQLAGGDASDDLAGGRVDHRDVAGPADRHVQAAAVGGQCGPPGPRSNGNRREHVEGRGVEDPDVPGVAVRHPRPLSIPAQRDVHGAAAPGRRRLFDTERVHVHDGDDVRLLAGHEQTARIGAE